MYAHVKQNGGFYFGMASGLVFPKAHLFVQAKYAFYHFDASADEGGFGEYNSHSTRGILSLATGFNL